MIHLTPNMLEAAYELLRTTPPFRGWKLPDGETISFHVTNSNHTHGQHIATPGVNDHIIKISAKRHKTMISLLLTMAHEMVHVREHGLGIRADVMHGKAFKRLADQVCKHHKFDGGQF